MKFLVLLAIVALAHGKSIDVFDPESTTAFGYLTRFGIPESERIRAAEESASRIVGGSAASTAQFPYQVGLLFDIIGSSGQGACGGSVLSSSRILTAAHCWNDGQNQGYSVSVRLGSNFLFSGGTVLTSSNVVVHDQWSTSLVRNDVAIIILTQNVGFSSTIQPVAIPSGSQLNENFDGETGVASGFGRTSDDSGISQNLNFVSLPIIANSVCFESYPFNIVASNICTSGANGRGTCQGDSGGPLVVTRNNAPLLVGVTSFVSANGCAIGLPAAYARVTSFISWINSN